eukprot:scaffold38333_cov66-Cyclotella_meneghiniana.AAC.1
MAKLQRKLTKFEEYDDDGILIYSPPPLDEVWLSKPERRERRHELEKQRNTQHCHRDRDIEEVHCRMKKSHDSTPPP